MGVAGDEPRVVGPQAFPRGVAALVTGLGGLLFETAILRRFGLVVGNTATASAITVGCFLAGLGLGSLLAVRARFGRPARAAARRYLGVGVAIAVAILVANGLPPMGPLAGVLLAILLVGGPAVAMGDAFPRLFAGLASGRVTALLVAANLLGSVGGAWLAGNLFIPELGITATAFGAALAYLGAAGCLAFWTREEKADGPVAATPLASLDLPAGAVRLAALSGLLIVGFELLLLRRMPFWIEGFQPTLAGVFAAALATTALGAALVALLPARARGVVCAGGALALAAVGACCGVHEHFGLAIARHAVRSDLGFHLRILAAAGLAAAPVGIAVGAVLPLLLAAGAPAVRGRFAARLFFAQGLGGLAGALLVGQFLPWWFPSAFFAATPLALACVVFFVMPGARSFRLAGVAITTAFAAFGWAGPGSPWAPEPPVRGSRFDRLEVYLPLDHATDAGTTASVVYDRSQHAMVLFTDEFRAAWTGPGTSYMKVLGHLPFLLRDELRDVAIIALGTGTTADAVCAWPDPRVVHVVEISPAVLSLADRFAADGPVPGARRATFRTDPRALVHVADGRRWIATAARASLDLVTMEPLLPYAPGTAALYSREFYLATRTALRDDGLCVQWVPTHAMPAAMFRTLLATFAAVFPHASVWLVDQSTLLVGSTRPHLPALVDLERRLAGAPAHARRTLHEAGLVAPRDFAVALLGALSVDSFPGAAVLTDDRPFLERIGYWSGLERLGFLSANLAELATLAARGVGVGAPTHLGSAHWTSVRGARLQALIARNDAAYQVGTLGPTQAAAAAAAVFSQAPESVLLHGETLRARRQALEAEVRARGPRALAEAARQFVQLDPGSAILQAASGADRSDQAARARATANAIAVDPTLPLTLPGLFGDGAVLPEVLRSPLEDVGLLVEGDELAHAATGPGPRAIALRAAFGVRVALALLARSGRETLSAAEAGALSEVLDPALLERLAEGVVAREGDLLAEVLPCWRVDLAMPAAFTRLAESDTSTRERMAAALAGRRGADAAGLLASFLVDQEPTVRRAAAGALIRSFGERIPYDSEGPPAERERAANALRALHNRRP